VSATAVVDELDAARWVGCTSTSRWLQQHVRMSSGERAPRSRSGGRSWASSGRAARRRTPAHVRAAAGRLQIAADPDGAAAAQAAPSAPRHPTSDSRSRGARPALRVPRLPRRPVPLRGPPRRALEARGKHVARQPRPALPRPPSRGARRRLGPGRAQGVPAPATPTAGPSLRHRAARTPTTETRRVLRARMNPAEG
jgi:hypothetical protein